MIRIVIALLISFMSITIYAEETAPAESRKNAPGPGKYIITIIPYDLEYVYLRFYPNSEIKRKSDPEKRSMEEFYPGDFAYLFGFIVSAKDLFGIGGVTTGQISFKYPNAWELSDSDRGSLSMYRVSQLWDNLGFDLEYTSVKSFFHRSRYTDPAAPQVWSIDNSMKAGSLSANFYLRLFELNNQKCSLSENLEALRMPPKGTAPWPVWDLFYLLASYDRITVESGSAFFTDTLVPAMGNVNLSSAEAHLFSAAVMLGAKVRIFENFFYLASIPVLSVYYSMMDTDSSGMNRRKGVESVFTSLKKYISYSTNPFEGYTKNLIRQAAGYNNGRWFIFGEVYYDIKNIGADEYTMQHSVLYVKVAGGINF